jgi:hypothetical protein
MARLNLPARLGPGGVSMPEIAYVRQVQRKNSPVRLHGKAIAY